VRTSLSPSAPVVDVAVHPVRPNLWAVVTASGEVWVTDDGGRGWRDVLEGYGVGLGGLSDDEAVLLDVSARVSEIVDDVAGAGAFELDGIDEGDEEALEELEQAAAEASAATDDVVFGVQTEVAAGQWLDDLPASVPGGRPRVAFTGAGVLLVARADGVRSSVDMGASWQHGLTEPVGAVAEVGPGEVLAVGPDGAWVSADFLRWSSVQLPMDPPPTDLVVDGGTFASGPAGVWFASEGNWQMLPGTGSTPPITVRPTSRQFERALMVSTGRDMLRAPSILAPADPVLGGPFDGVVDIERLGEGALVAAATDGPRVSEDDGRTWAPLTRGLGDPRSAAIAVVGSVVVLAGAGGVYVMRPLPRPVPEATPTPPSLASFVPLGALIHSAGTRRELTQRIGRRIVAAAIPEVTGEFITRRDVALDWENDEPTGTETDVDGYWQVRSVLRWTPGRTRNASSFDAEAADDVPVLVVGDSVVVDDGEAPQVLFSTVSRGGAVYRNVLAGRITDLYKVRARLLLEGEPVDPVRAVLRELRVQELEAMLDVLTNGAVTQWRLDATNAMATP